MLWAFFTYVWPEYKRRAVLVDQISTLRRSMSVKNVGVLQRLPSDKTANPSMSQILLVLSEEQPKRAEELAGQYDAQQAQMLKIQQAGIRYAGEPAGVFADYDKMNVLLNNYKKLEDDRGLVVKWLDALDKEADRVRQAIDAAPGEVDTAKKALAAAVSSYSKAAASSNILPPMDKATATLQKLVKEAEADISEYRPISATEVSRHLIRQATVFHGAVQEILLAERTVNTLSVKLTSIIDKRQSEFPTVSELLAGAQAILKKACSELYDDPTYDDALDTAKSVNALCAGLDHAVETLIAAMIRRDERWATLSALFKLGYRDMVDADLKKVASDMVSARKALVGGTYKDVARWATEMDADCKKALDGMQALQKMHDANIAAIAALSKGVATVDARRTSKVESKWKDLQKFHPDDWDNVQTHFDQATKILIALFDDPANAQDVASKAARANSMEVQDFKGSEAIITQMQADFAKASLLLDELENQYQKALDARAHYQEALAKAKVKFEAAVKERDAQNKLVDASVDQMLQEAQKAAVKAQKAVQEKIYTDVMAYAQDVIELSEKASVSARHQVSAITTSIAQKERNKDAARTAVAGTQAAIQKATRAAVLPHTNNKLAEAVTKMEEASRLESKALTMEDLAMAKALKDSAARYEEAAVQAREANTLLQQDIASYKELLSQANSSVASAVSAINSAQRVCGDSRSGNSGDTVLSRAKSNLPDVPANGATRESIRRAIEAAQSTATEANRAKGLAESAVAEYLAEQRRKREREEAIERRRREEEARERRRREESEERSRRSSSSSISSGFGSGGSSSRGSFGGGGSSKRTGF